MTYPEELVRDFANGIGSVFVGAGASIDAGLPGWAELLRKVTSQTQLPRDLSYLDIAQYFENAYGRDELVNRIWELLQTARAPTRIHEEIVDLPISRVFTTNLDTLLESAAVRKKRTPRKITNTDRSVTTNPNHLTIFKLHGDLDQRQSYVITSDDYEGYAATFPISTLMMSYELHTRTVLFVGYSFNDFDLRMIIKAVSTQAGRFGRQHYALLTNPTLEAEKELERRKIRSIPLRSEAGELGAAVARWLSEFKERVRSFNRPTAPSSRPEEEAGRPAALAVFPPPPPTFARLIGRQREIEQLRESLSRPTTRLAVVKGFPGTGKTSLAIEVIRLTQSQPERPGPTGAPQPGGGRFEHVVWIPNRKAEKPRPLADVVGAITQALSGMPPGGDGSANRVEAERLMSRHRVLVVIDNVSTTEENELVNWAAAAPAPSCVLITTRGIRTAPVAAGASINENTVTLKGLPEQEAREFIRTAATEIAGANPGDVDDLVRITDGNPQALLLAAGVVRSRTISVSQLVRHLRSDAPGGRTDEALFEQLFLSSWSLLSTPAKNLFMATSLFSTLGSIDCDALATAADAGDYEGAIRDLRAANLVDDSDGRVSVHPLSRGFARKRYRELPLETRIAMRKRQLRYYLAFIHRNAVRNRPIELPPYWNALVSESMASIDPEWPAIEDTMEWALSSGCSEEVVEFVMLAVHYMDSRFLNQERSRYVNEAIRISKAAERKNEEALLRIDALGWTLIEEGQPDRAKEEINQGFKIARNMQNTDLMALAYAWLARIETQAGDSAGANGLIQFALGMKTSPWIWYRVNFAAGDIAYSEDNCARALQFYQTAANQVDEYGGEEGYQIETRLGLAWAGLGDLDEAERNFNHISGLAPIAIGQLHAKYGLALVALKRGNVERAKQLADEVREVVAARGKSSLLLTMIDKLMKSARHPEKRAG